MNIKISAKHRPISNGDFGYSNMESKYGQNTQYFTYDGKPYEIIAGELHYSRVPSYRWKEMLLKMRECGLNAVSSYVFWNYHEEIKDKFDFDGDNNIAAFLQICKEIKMPCILRIGPYCHAEVLHGGLPERIMKMPNKRTDDPEYLAEVRSYWTRLYKEISPYLDGETVMAIQVENEYRKGPAHIHTLRDILEDIGYKSPYYTLTAWSGIVDRSDKRFVPTFGTYPDAPWAKGVEPLKPNNRFSIASNKVDVEIGADVAESEDGKLPTVELNVDGANFDDMPYASCEVGPGNQVTHHRRPIISEHDGCGTGFGRFASGLNWIGYYMFAGGRNPNTRLLQERKEAGAPNDYPIIDYDFQAPLSRYGVCRPHGDRMRLMHLFIKEFDPNICTKQPFFPKWKSADPLDISFLKCSVRMDENGSGYFFSSTHEKGLKYEDFKDVTVDIHINDKVISLPSIDVKADTLFFYPFNIQLGSKKFDYILAQPIVSKTVGNKTVCYFVECVGVKPKCKVDGKEISLDFSENGTDIGDVKIIVLPLDKARKFHYINGTPYFAEGTVYADGETIYCEQIGKDISSEIKVRACDKKDLPYEKYMFATGNIGYYEVTVPHDVVNKNHDVRLNFEFTGLNMQVFSNNTLIDDFYNIDGKYEIYLRDYAKYLDKDNVITIRISEKTEKDLLEVYNEKPIELNKIDLKLINANLIELNVIE